MSAAQEEGDCPPGSLKEAPPRLSFGDDSRYSSSALGKVEFYESLRLELDRALPTTLRRAAERVHGSPVWSASASNSFSMARTSESLFATRQASTKSWSRAESFSLRAIARYLERSRAGMRRTNCTAKSSGSVKVIFLVPIAPYYHIKEGWISRPPVAKPNDRRRSSRFLPIPTSARSVPLSTQSRNVRFFAR
jgi:hypothetical protein